MLEPPPEERGEPPLLAPPFKGDATVDPPPNEVAATEVDVEFEPPPKIEPSPDDEVDAEVDVVAVVELDPPPQATRNIEAISTIA